MEAKEDDSQLLLLAEAGIEDPCAPAGSEDGTPAAGRKRRLRSASPHSPRCKGFAPRKQRSRSAEMHECLVNAGQEMQQDKVLFQSLRGAELRKLDPRHKGEGRYFTLKRKSVPTAEAQQRSTRSNDKRGAVDVEDADDEGDEGGERAEWLKLSGQGMSLSELESIEAWMQETAAESAARAVGVGRRYAGAVLGAYQQTGHVPPAEETGDGRGGKRDTIKTGRGRRFSKAHIFEFRSWVIDQALIGDNIHHRNIAVELERITGAAPTRRAIRRLRGILGICRGKVVGANSAKTSRRVRLARYRFVKRRMEEDRRADPGMRPIRVYSDETYANANTNVGETWVLEEKAWRETVMRRAEEAIERGEETPAVSSLAGMKGHAGAHVQKKSSGRGGRAVIVNALYALPPGVQDADLVDADGNHLPRAGPVEDVLTIWAASSSKGDYHGNFSNAIYLHWMDSKLMPALVALSKKHGGRPMTFIIDGASYHSAKYPSALDFSKMNKEELVEICGLIGVEIQHLDRVKTKEDTGLDAVKADALKQFLRARFPPARSRAEVLFHDYLEREKVPNRELWVIDEEPAYHFELQVVVL